MPAIKSTDRIAIIAPHPDDEALGTGGLIQQAVTAGAQVRVIYLTNGDHNQIAFKLYSGLLFMSPKRYQQFGEKRMTEAVAAMSVLGLRYDQLRFLGYPDWGVFQIWRDYWEDEKPFRSDATRADAVPYPKDYGYKHLYKPQTLLTDLKSVLTEFRPTIVITTHPCDTNPDHRAAANFVRLALLELLGKNEILNPQLYFFVIHFGDWPKPYHYHPEVEMTVPSRLLDDGDWFSLPITAEQAEKKHKAILENSTQLTTRQFYLDAFARANELYATPLPEKINNIPPDLALDWKQAVRNQSLQINIHPRRQPLHNGAIDHPISVSLKETAFLRQGSDLIVSIDFHNRLGPRSNAHIFLFGYQRGISFAKLPKIHINYNPIGHLHVFDDELVLANHGITKIAIGDKLILRIPLKLLGGLCLDHIFTATHANLGEISADDTAWQLYEFTADGETS